MNLQDKRVLVTGGRGFLGKHLVKKLEISGVHTRFSQSDVYDLKHDYAIKVMLHNLKPDVIIHAAAHAGGIGLNQQKPGELFYNNAVMGIQLMEQARLFGIEKFVTIGTVCEYPKYTPVPFNEEKIWEGYPEETNAAYGLAKKMLLVQGQAYRQQYGMNVIHLLPVNLYGPGDNFNPETSHVIPALIKKFIDAKENNLPSVEIWGNGIASREFLYVKDAADAIVLATEKYNEPEPINIGSGDELSIESLANCIAAIVEYEGVIVFDLSKPNGQPHRRLDISKAQTKFGFRRKVGLYEGLRKTITWYLENR